MQSWTAANVNKKTETAIDKEVKYWIKIETDGKDVFKTLKIDAEDFSIAIEQTY